MFHNAWLSILSLGLIHSLFLEQAEAFVPQNTYPAIHTHFIQKFASSGHLSPTILKSTSTETDLDIDLLTEVRSEIFSRDGGEDAWTETTSYLTNDVFDSSLSQEEVELLLATTFRWKAYVKASSIMKKYQYPTLPDPAKIKQGVEWLKEGLLEMSMEQICKNIQSLPHTYLKDPEGSYKKALGSAPKKYRDASTLKALIEHDPAVLGITVNCADEGCASECGSCWVAYGNRFPF